MRQAGRYLPEYRALRERHSRAEMLAAPELAVEATPQPLKRFPLDAAINLGHGILPETPIDSVSRMADYVHSWKGGAG
jgi:uroporphyrinogen decarboxylase